MKSSDTSPYGCKADFLAVTDVIFKALKEQSFSFFAPKLAHKWAQTVGAKAALVLLNTAISVNAAKIRLTAIR